MKLIVTYPVMIEKDDTKYVKDLLSNSRLLESWIWKQSASLGKYELSWNDIYNFWDLICFSMPNNKVDFVKLTAVLQELDLKKFQSMNFDSGGLHAKGMRYWLYPKEEYGVH